MIYKGRQVILSDLRQEDMFNVDQVKNMINVTMAKHKNE